METSGSVRLRVPIAASLSGLRGGRGRRFPQRSVPNPSLANLRSVSPLREFSNDMTGVARGSGFLREFSRKCVGLCRQLPLREFCYLRVRRRISKIAGENYFYFCVRISFHEMIEINIKLMVFTSMQIGRFGWKWQLSLLELKLTIIISYI